MAYVLLRKRVLSLHTYARTRTRTRLRPEAPYTLFCEHNLYPHTLPHAALPYPLLHAATHTASAMPKMDSCGAVFCDISLRFIFGQACTQPRAVTGQQVACAATSQHRYRQLESTDCRQRVWLRCALARSHPWHAMPVCCWGLPFI